MNAEVSEQLLLLFVLMAVGFAAAKAGLIDKTGSDKVSALISRVTMPAMYIATFMAQPFSAESMKRSGVLLAISAVYYVLAAAMGFAYVRLVRADEKTRGVYQFMIIFSNAAYMGFPVLRAVLGEEAIFYGAFFNLPFNILAYSLGIWLLRHGRTDVAMRRREMFLNPGTLGVLLGVVLFLVSPLVDGTKLSDAFYQGARWKGLDALGDTTVPLSMLVIGSVLATVKPGAVVKNLRVWGVCALRLLALPLLMQVCLLPLPLDPMTRGIPVLVAGMPCAVFCVILSKEYGGDEKTASVGVFLSTLLSAATIPLIASLL